MKLLTSDRILSLSCFYMTCKIKQAASKTHLLLLKRFSNWIHVRKLPRASWQMDSAGSMLCWRGFLISLFTMVSYYFSRGVDCYSFMDHCTANCTYHHPISAASKEKREKFRFIQTGKQAPIKK